MSYRPLIKVEEFGARLDWATFSAPKDVEQADHFRQFCQHFMHRERERWNVSKVGTIGDYDGEKIEDVFYGSREHDGHEIITTHGENTCRLVEEVIAHEIPAKVTRLDARVLARCDAPAFEYPDRIRRAILNAGKAEGKNRRKKINLFGNDYGFDGTTVGARSSEKFLRIYDHDSKHGDGPTGRYWAHEGEYKGGSAIAAFEGYKSAPNREAYCAGLVRSTLKSMRVPCEWLKDVQDVKIVVGRKITTDDKRLLYQEKIGIPMLERLILAGRGEEVKALLIARGIDKLFAVGENQLPK